MYQTPYNLTDYQAQDLLAYTTGPIQNCYPFLYI